MVNEIAPSLYPEVQDAVTPPGKGEHGYYRRDDNGWIITAPVWPSYRSDMEFKGYVFLPQYGTWVHGTPWGNTNRDDRGIGYNALQEPWRRIFARGGAKEFPVTQIIAYGWHRQPAYREVTFPQIKGVKIYDLPCPECSRVFGSMTEDEAVANLRTHLTSTVDRPHSYSPTDLRELGKELGVNFDSARIRRYHQEPAEEAVRAQQAVPLLGEIVPSAGYGCRFGCGWMPKLLSKNPANAQAGHERFCALNPARAASD